jgi:glucose/arabinose dehydrogenase
VSHARVSPSRFAPALLALFAVSFAPAAWAQNILPGTISPAPQLKLTTTLTPQASGAPDFGISYGDSRFMFIGEQNGSIRTLDFSQSNPLLGTNFLNTDSVLGGDPLSVGGNGRVLLDDTGTGERGLIGAAFHPGFNDPSSPGFHKFYTYTSETLTSSGGINSTNFRNPLEPTASGNSNSSDPIASNQIANGYNCQNVLREWTVQIVNGVPNVNTSVASRVVMRVAKPGRFHNGGGITFGPDGYLYMPLGDGGGGNSNGGNDGGSNFTADNGHTNPGNPDSPGGWTGQGNAQDRRTVYGKVLRIKPTTDADANTKVSANGNYRIPLTNPYVGNSTNFVEEIYAYGFRNPFRISFDDRGPNPTNRLFVADVGQDRNSFSREEISNVVGGGNYGWVAKSGTNANTLESAYTTSQTLIDPIAQYPTTATNDPNQTDRYGGLAAIGGFVYHGSLLPQLTGMYVFADLDRGNGVGRILYTNVNDASLQVFELNINSPLFAQPQSNIHGVAQDANGELYMLYGNGQVVELVPEPATWILALTAAGLGAICYVRRRRVALAA